MSILFRRIENYCVRTKSNMLSLPKRVELGKIVIQHYLHDSGVKMPLHRAVSKEPEGDFTVLSYPKAFNPAMDRLIDEYYQQNRNRKRKRIPFKSIKYK